MKLETKVGLFFTGAIALVAVLIFRTEKLEFGGKRNQSEHFTYFDTVAGLPPQGAVRIAGVKVGDVRTITLENGRAKVVIGLSKDVPVFADASVSLGAIGILGEKFVDLDPGHSAKGPFPEGSPLPSKAGISLDTLMETLADVGKNVKGVTQALNESIGGEQGREKLNEIVDNIRVLTAEFRSMAQENHGAINNTMANVEALTTDLRDRLPKLATQFETMAKSLNAMIDENRPELKGTMTDVHKMAQSFQGTADNLKILTDRLNKGEGTLGKLLNDETTVKKINEAVDNVNNMLGGFNKMDFRLDMNAAQWSKRSDSRVGLGKLLNDETTVKKINEAVDNVNNMLGGFNKMDFRLDMNAAQWSKRSDSRVGLGIDIVPRPDYWYALGFASTPDGKINTSTSTITQLDPVTGKPVTVLSSNRNVTMDQAFTASAQFAKRIGPAVFSAGIVENKGGAGFELRALDGDSLRLGVLAYDFTKRDDKPNPRYRLTSSYQFWKGAYVQAGIQDIANKELRTFFFGGGLRWKDDDLKKMVGLAGVAK